MKVMLDTNVYTALMRGDEATANTVRASEAVLVSAIVVGELLYGFRHGSRFDENQRQLGEFIASPYVHFIPVTYVTADRFSRIAASLRRRGKPLPSNDIWIAAHALETGADLLTFDGHFSLIEGLVWRTPA